MGIRACGGWSGLVILQELKGLREKIRGWNKNRGLWGSTKIKVLEGKLQDLMQLMEQEGVSEDLRKERLEVINNLWNEYRT